MTGKLTAAIGPRAAALAVCLAAVLPYLSTLDNYFVRDDFGVVQLLAGKPATYFPQWFVSSWMDGIWGAVPDEIRPFPAVSYQLTSLAGPASPFLHHALNIAIHAGNGLLVLAIGLILVRLTMPAATLAAVVFVVLPVHGESVAWITGRVDSMPAFFYMASFLAFAQWRAKGERIRSFYALSLALLFVALFTKQTTITMIATLVAWDLLTTGWPVSWRRALRVYLPFVLMTGGYLVLRYVLFGQVVREGQLNADGLRLFARLFDHHVAHVVAGRVTAGSAAWLILLATAAGAWLLLRGRPAAERRRVTALLMFFGPIWWAIGIAPTMVAGYESPRHVYLAAAGWAIVLGVVADLAWARAHRPVWQRVVSAAGLALVMFHLVTLHGVVDEWNRIAAVSHQAVIDVRREVVASTPGSLLIVGAPVRSWEWAVPFAVQPPFTRTALTDRAFIVTPRALHCCRGQWFEETRRALRAWDERAPIVVLRWDPDTGELSKLTDREYPALRSVGKVLGQLGSPEALDSSILRAVAELPAAR